jgi:alkanesulfonate monooxygenase SsuD/methylene tetrahydromethanopterin reductase-like flavin-dependent oxidoreductase (luciferase family)
VQHAVFLPPFDELADPRVVARLAAEADEHGWDGFFVWDHITYRQPVQALADPWVVLTAAACATQRVRLGPMVTPLARRRPAVVARQTASLDVLSGGRLVVGVGLGGDNSRELSATGEQTDDRVRAAMLDEALDVLARAWSGEVVQYDGDHYRVDGIRFLPTPVQRPGPPVWVGARHGNRGPLRRAARYDGVFPIGAEEPSQLAEIVHEVTALREGRTGAFDVVIGKAPGADPAPWQAVGATWWCTNLPLRATADTALGVVRDGPPT